MPPSPLLLPPSKSHRTSPAVTFGKQLLLKLLNLLQMPQVMPELHVARGAAPLCAAACLAEANNSAPCWWCSQGGGGSYVHI